MRTTPQTFPMYRLPEYNFNNPQFQNSFIVTRMASNPRRYSSLFEAEEQMGRSALHLMFTNGRQLPWTCNCVVFWRDLGENFHPRFVRDARCSTSTCYHGHYSCIPRKYSVPVLKRVAHNDDISESDRFFDNEFYFVTISVTSSCYCGRRVVS